jgi:hypothetical protein
MIFIPHILGFITVSSSSIPQLLSGTAARVVAENFIIVTVVIVTETVAVRYSNFESKFKSKKSLQWEQKKKPCGISLQPISTFDMVTARSLRFPSSSRDVANYCHLRLPFLGLMKIVNLSFMYFCNHKYRKPYIRPKVRSKEACFFKILFPL